MQAGATKAPTQAATRAAVILTSIVTQILGFPKMRIVQKVIVRAMNLSKRGGEGREGREKSIVHLSVEVTSAPFRSGSREP